MKYLKLLFVSLFIFLLACNNTAPQDLTPHQTETSQSINGGYTESGEPGVVYISHDWGFACTGTLVEPNVVITAKHCVLDTEGSYGQFPLYGFHIGIGPDAWNLTGNYGVEKIFIYDTTTNIEDKDIAILVLDSDIPSSLATPYEYALSLNGENFMTPNSTLLTLIGYGESICGESNNAGVKLRTEDTYLGFISDNDYATQGRGANHGDSGGPVFSSTMKLVGVISRGSDECSGEYAGLTIATSIAKHIDIIRQAMEYAGHCGPTSYEEQCNDNIDNNCDGHIDESCIDDGNSCNEDWQCKSNICVDQNGVKSCLKSCDPNSSTNSCGSGKYCQMIGCNQAICAPGSPGSKEFYESCNTDTDCKSLFCRQAPDGAKRCLIPCQEGANQCLMNEVCTQTENSCGACVSSDFISSQKALGEPCNSSSECSSNNCTVWGTIGFCTQTCTSQNECPSGFHCGSNICVAGELGEMGDPCDIDFDCESGLSCVDLGSGFKHCSIACNAGESCEKDGYACLPAENGGNWCKLIGGAALGDQCGDGVNCASGLFCMETSTNDYRCIKLCNAQNECPSYTACLPLNNKAYCIPFDSAPKSSDGGGSSSGCSSSSSSQSTDFYLFSLILGLFFLIKRKFILSE